MRVFRQIPDYINQICTVLEESGYKTYIVGGAVRDALAGIKEIDDWDLATEARQSRFWIALNPQSSK